jgi:tRNA (cmo5U34)-methyltransferase
VEESQEMADRWWGPGDLLVKPVQEVDLVEADVIICNLVLMFLRPDEQGEVLAKLHRAIKPGGVLILVERMLPPSGYLSIVTSRLTLNAKLAGGISPEEIVRKELSIAGSQRPIDARILQAHGATEWFRFGDFAGWVIEKELPRH